MTATERDHLLRSIDHILKVRDWLALSLLKTEMARQGFAWSVIGEFGQSIEASFTRRGEASIVSIHPSDELIAVCKAARLAVTRERVA